MNYTSFIIKIIDKPFETILEKTISVTHCLIQIPQLKSDMNGIILSAAIWGKLGQDMIKYYQINDYIIVEGYLSTRKNSIYNFEHEPFKMLELSIYKIYPFNL